MASNLLLPIGLVQSLQALPQNIPIAGLLRHAEREDIPIGDFGNEVNLTSNGYLSCQELADELCHPLNALYTSPVKRCLQTAQVLLQRAQEKTVVTSSLLGDPGAFIVDSTQTHDFWRWRKPIEVVQHLLSDAENPSGFCINTASRAEQFIRFLVQHAKMPGLSLFITHDSILSVVLGILFRDRAVEEMWPSYLEGLFLWQEPGFLHVMYRHCHQKIAWSNAET